GRLGRRLVLAPPPLSPYLSRRNKGIPIPMTFKRLIAAATAFALGLAGCATVDTPPKDAVPGPALWQVSDENTTVYLFGTVHALPKDREWFDARIERAFTVADELVTEIDMADVSGSAQTMQQAGTLP